MRLDEHATQYTQNSKSHLTGCPLCKLYKIIKHGGSGPKQLQQSVVNSQEGNKMNPSYRDE